VDGILGCGDILFSINPLEYGIEILRLIRFELIDKDYVLDGEMHESELFLMRRPVILLNLSFLREQYQKSGKVGQNIGGEQDKHEIRSLKLIPKKMFRMFSADIDLKRSRIRVTENPMEKKFFEQWLADFEKPFRQVVDKDDKSIKDISGLKNPLTWMCPATWKSLEMAFSLNLV